MSVRVLKPGLLTTVQDLGRAGWQRHGVVVGGAMDTPALRTANLLVCNAHNAAALEVTLLGPSLEFQRAQLIAITGADLHAQLDDEPVSLGRACVARAGSVLSFAGVRSGCRAYVAFAGGIDVPRVLGSRSTDLRARIGGVAGRALQTDDVLRTGTASVAAQRLLAQLVARDRTAADWGAGSALTTATTAQPELRVLRGLEYGLFTEASRRALLEEPFTVSARSDRMGYRLEGPVLALSERQELISSPMVQGTLQVPPSGQPILLMADRQSVGGYPRIAQVITVDLPLLAQAAPGARLHFREVTLAHAQSALLARERELHDLELAIRLRLG